MAFYISHISLKNVRSFGPNLELHFRRNSDAGSSEFPPRMILIGENGTGKSSLLRAITLGLADEKDASGLLAEESTGQLVSNGTNEATIVIKVCNREDDNREQEIKTVIRNTRGQDRLKDKQPEEFAAGLVCAYGIGRAAEGPDQARGYRISDSVYTLFRYDDGLISAELILRRLKDFLGEEWYPHVMDRIKEALGLPKEVTIDLPSGGGVRVSGPRIDNDIPLGGWADGYRMTLGWILDLYHWAMRAECIDKTGDVAGIVLIDELEQHLHPSMQIDLPTRLKKLLPNMQIIATTHSPLVALGANPDELVVLKRVNGIVQAYESVRDFHGYSVEDMIADPSLFDSSVYSPVITQKLNRYHDLVTKAQDCSSEEKSELEELGSDLISYGIPEASENPIFKDLKTILDQHNL